MSLFTVRAGEFPKSKSAHTHARSNHKAMVQRGLNALRKPSQASVAFWVDDGQEGLAVFAVLEGEGTKEWRSHSVRGLVEVWLQRSEMTGDGTPAMETIGQIPGSCEELFGQRGNGKSELVGASQEWLGRRQELFFFSFFFPRSV